MSDAIQLGRSPELGADRDAIHVAVAPVVCADAGLVPGQHVGLTADGKASVSAKRRIGIVDPFLDKPVRAGECFWLVLYPNSVIGMRHHWSHPDFAASGKYSVAASTSEAWLRDFAEEAGLSYGSLIEKVTEYVESGGEPWVEQGSEQARSAFGALPEEGAEFWLHFENMTGIKRPANPQWYMPFSCSC